MLDLSKLTDKEKAVVLARREYMRKWRTANPDKQKEYSDRFFEKQMKEQQKKNLLQS